LLEHFFFGSQLAGGEDFNFDAAVRPGLDLLLKNSREMWRGLPMGWAWPICMV
jgi:hypothetical protein